MCVTLCVLVAEHMCCRPLLHITMTRMPLQKWSVFASLVLILFFRAHVCVPHLAAFCGCSGLSIRALCDLLVPRPAIIVILLIVLREKGAIRYTYKTTATAAPTAAANATRTNERRSEMPTCSRMAFRTCGFLYCFGLRCFALCLCLCLYASLSLRE